MTDESNPQGNREHETAEGWSLATDGDGGEPIPVEDEPELLNSDSVYPPPAEGRGVYVTPKRILAAAAIVLTIILIALLIYLLLLLSKRGAIAPLDREPRMGLRAELVITGPGKGERPTFNGPMGAAWSRDGKFIYVADSANDRICQFDRQGRFLREFGGFGIAKPLAGAKATWNPGELNYPVDVTVDDAGLVYVADFYNDSISVFDPNGKFVRRFPDPSKPTGKGSSGFGSKGIAVTALDFHEGKIYATDSFQIFVFDRSGKLISQFGKPGMAPGDFDRPNGIAVFDVGRIVISDSNNSRVQEVSLTGSPLWTAGRPRGAETSEAAELSFIVPRGITKLNAKSLLVADPIAQHLVQISSDGKFIATYGERGTRPAQLNFPNDVAALRGRILVADRANNRVQVVRLVTQ